MIKLLNMTRWFLYFAVLPVFLTVLVTGATGAVQEDIATELKLAREDLRLSKDTEERIKAELIRLKKSGKGTPEMVHYYEIYLKRVQDMVKENREAVKEMETAYARYFPSSELPSGAPSVLDLDISAEEEIDEVSRLDKELNESLADFDEMIRKELDVLALEIEQIRARTAQRMQQLASEAAEAARQARESGSSGSSGSLSSYGYGYGDEGQMGSEEGETGQSGQQGGQQGGQNSGQQGGQYGGQQGGQDGGQQGGQYGGQQGGQDGGQQGGQYGGQQGGQYGGQQGGQDGGQQGGQYGGQQGGQYGGQQGGQDGGQQDGGHGQQGRDSGGSTSGPGGSGAGGEGSGVGTDTYEEQAGQYDGQDDDIVARQLREAAENETDPELREKLWKEYRDYKSGQ